MRHRLNLDLATLDKALILVHGGYASGKTRLAGDFLVDESKHGSVRFLNVKGEDGYMSLASLGLGEVGETIESYTDYLELLGEWKKLGLRAVAVDSLKPLVRLVMYHTLGEDRLPRVEKQGPNEWSNVHFATDMVVQSLREAAPFVLCTCPSDKSVNQLDGQTYITPDLPGRQAAGSAGWFDFVGFMKAQTLGPGRVLRTVTFAPSSNIVTRQRLASVITEDIKIPDGTGGWAAIRAAISKAMEKKT